MMHMTQRKTKASSITLAFRNDKQLTELADLLGIQSKSEMIRYCINFTWAIHKVSKLKVNAKK